MPIDWILTTPDTISITSLVVNLGIGTVISFVLAWHFRRFSATVSNRSSFAHVFPLIILTTILLISVVKSSLALSLGLVGALSIVRFRTPIKEPEELAYLFMAIGVGVGLGADFRLITPIASTMILGVLTARSLICRDKRERNLFLNLEVPGGTHDGALEKINGMLRKQVQKADVRRVDLSNGLLQATFAIGCKDDEQLVTAVNCLQEGFPQASITFIEQSNLPAA